MGYGNLQKWVLCVGLESLSLSELGGFVYAKGEASAVNGIQQATIIILYNLGSNLAFFFIF